MKKTIVSTIVALGLGFTGAVFADDNCSMQVAPSAITIGSANEPAQITMHTDIVYSSVDLTSLLLTVELESDEVEDDVEVVEVESTFADNRGQLVARVDWLDNEVIETILEKFKDGAIQVEFELAGQLADDAPFECEDEVKVIAVKKDK